MDEDEDGLLIFDEVDMQDVVDEWAKTYTEGVKVSRWYYDSHSRTLIVGLLVEDVLENGEIIRGENNESG